METTYTLGVRELIQRLKRKGVKCGGRRDCRKHLHTAADLTYDGMAFLWISGSEKSSGWSARLAAASL
jgi:hypothetical protein